MAINFENDQEELEFLRGVVSRLYFGQGRETPNASYDLDYAWDLIEEYGEEILSG